MYPERIAAARKAIGRQITLSEKILYTIIGLNASTAFEGGKSNVDCSPNSAELQDATAQIKLKCLIFFKQDVLLGLHRAIRIELKVPNRRIEGFQSVFL
jgi:hypothetical protein